MKFVHIADIHFDVPFSSLNRIQKLGDIRRLEQREVFKKVIQYIKANNIEYLFISGDLYEHQYIRQSTIEYIGKLFEEISDTKIYISPGNHDPFIINSYYNKYKFSENVHIFGHEIQVIRNEGVNIYGYGFSDFYDRNSRIEEIKLNRKEDINILITHGSTDSGNEQDKEYNPLSEKKLSQIGFDYIALGHIHKSNYANQNFENIIYPGSLISLGFDELRGSWNDCR